VWTYEINNSRNNTTVGDKKQAIDQGPKPLDQFGIAFPEFLKLLGLFLEYGKERFGGVAAIDFGGQRVVAEIFSGLLGVLG
jgi:hypothetical protein